MRKKRVKFIFYDTLSSSESTLAPQSHCNQHHNFKSISTYHRLSDSLVLQDDALLVGDLLTPGALVASTLLESMKTETLYLNITTQADSLLLESCCIYVIGVIHVSIPSYWMCTSRVLRSTNGLW